MKRTNRKGFTTVELVIVIAVIAILAAVLIPTFVSLINKANQSADIQAARAMDNTIKTEAAGKDIGLGDALQILKDEGYNIFGLQPLFADFTFYFDDASNGIVLADKTGKVHYPKNGELSASSVILSVGSGSFTMDAGTVEEVENVLENGGNLALTDNVKLESNTAYKISGDATLDLNGKMLDASVNQSRPFELTEGATLTINAEGSTVKCGLYGLVNIPAGTSGTIIINGGTFISETDNGSFLKLRAGTGNVKIVLNDVTYIDYANDGYILNTAGFEGTLDLTINGGSFTAFCGLQLTKANNTVIKDATFNTKAYALSVASSTGVKVQNCNFTTGTALDGQNVPAYSIHANNNGSVEVTGCAFNAAHKAFGVLNSGGSIVANNNSGTVTYITTAVHGCNENTSLFISVNGNTVLNVTK